MSPTYYGASAASFCATGMLNGESNVCDDERFAYVCYAHETYSGSPDALCPRGIHYTDTVDESHMFKYTRLIVV